MPHTRFALLVAALLLALTTFAQDEPEPLAPRQIVAGEIYTESFTVSCARKNPTVTVTPAFFEATAYPENPVPGRPLYLNAIVPITVPAGDYKLTFQNVCVVGGNEITLTVLPPIKLRINPASNSVTRGATTSYTVTVSSKTYRGPVELRIPPPEGTMGLPENYRVTLDPATVMVTGPTARPTSTITVGVPANTTLCAPPRGCELVVRARSDRDIRIEPVRATLFLKPEVEISFDPKPVEVPTGKEATALIQVKPLFGFRGQVALSQMAGASGMPAGVTAEFEDSLPVDIQSDAPQTKGLKLKAVNVTPAETVFQRIVKGSPTPAVPATMVTVNYKIVGPVLTYASFSPTDTDIRVSDGSKITLNAVVNRNGCTGDLKFTPNPKPIDLITFDPVSTANGITGIVTFKGAEVNVNFSFGLTVSATGCGSATGSFSGIILGTGGAIPPPVPVTAALVPAAQTIQRGQAAAYTLTLNRGTTSGPIALAVTGLPAGVTTSILPNPVTGNTAQITLGTNTATPAGTFPFTVTASLNSAPLTTANGSLMVTVPAPLPTATPSISSFTPTSGASGTPVQIFGANLGNVQNVFFNGTVASFVPVTPSQVNATVPPLATTGPITIITSGGTAASPAPFIVGGSAQVPQITGFTPTSGASGTPVQIFGVNLNNPQNVFFNGTPAAFAPITPTQVNATVPGLATTGPITIVTAAGTAVSPTPFIVGSSSQAPQITGFTPTSGASGTPVQIQGVNLNGVFDVSLGTPAFGFTSIGFTPFSANRVDIVIPPGVPSGFFRVATPGGVATSPNAFNVTTPNLPEIGGFNPSSGPAGTRVEIIGSNLGAATQVTFGGAVASFEPPQPNRIFATVPPNAATGQIRVTTPNGTATSFASFAVTSGGPVITDIQPRMGQPGFSVTIAGANLTGASEVTFNGVRGSIGIVLANFVQVFVPDGATTGPVRITTPNGTATSSFAFTVQP